MLLLLVGMSGGNLSLVLTVVGIFTRLLGADVDIVGIPQTYVYCKETLDANQLKMLERDITNGRILRPHDKDMRIR